MPRSRPPCCRTPTDAEVAAELDISEQDLQDILRQISFVGVAALDEVFLVGGDRSERTTLGDTIPDAAAGPVAMFEDKESKEILSQAIMQLGDRERTVLSLYYYEGLTLAEIGEILGVTESRVCQIHTKAVLQLRARLSDRTTPDGSDPAGPGPVRRRPAGGPAERGHPIGLSSGRPVLPGRVLTAVWGSGPVEYDGAFPTARWGGHADTEAPGRVQRSSPCGGAAPGKENRWEDQPWLLSRLGSCWRPACISATRHADGTRRCVASSWASATGSTSST